jgi:hypothetical protein
VASRHRRGCCRVPANHCACFDVLNSKTGFCRHFIASNYQPMSKRPEFSTLEGENLEYIEANQVRVVHLPFCHFFLPRCIHPVRMNI